MQELFLFTLHEGLPRQGPGSTACTEKIFSFLPGLTQNPAVPDIGCGSGMQIISIARISPKACITATDVHVPFLVALNKRAKSAGFSERIRCVQASMDSLPIIPSAFDLIWAEGSIFIIGVEQGIKSWKNT